MKIGKLIDEHSKKNAEIIEAAMKDPSKYQGCPLCLGRGNIAGATAMWGYVCPTCNGHRIIKVKGKEVKVWERS